MYHSPPLAKQQQKVIDMTRQQKTPPEVKHRTNKLLALKNDDKADEVDALDDDELFGFSVGCDELIGITVGIVIGILVGPTVGVIFIGGFVRTPKIGFNVSTGEDVGTAVLFDGPLVGPTDEIGAVGLILTGRNEGVAVDKDGFGVGMKEGITVG